MTALPRMLLSLALVAGAAAPASAQEWRVSFGKRFGDAAVRVDLASRGHASCCATTPGHYETVEERVWVPGTRERVWVPARYETYVDSCGRVRQRLVCAGRYEWIEQPGRYEVHCRRVWVPARTLCSKGLHHGGDHHAHQSGGGDRRYGRRHGRRGVGITVR